MAKGQKTGGRKAGTPNKSTAAVKTALTEAFDKLGGVPALVTWGRDNLTDFYKLWVKVLPQEVHMAGKDGGPIESKQEIDLSQLDAAQLRNLRAIARAITPTPKP